MNPDPQKVIGELLQQNKELRMKVAVLSAQHKFLEEINMSMTKSQQGLTPELLSQLSPAALHALQTLEFE